MKEKAPEQKSEENGAVGLSGGRTYVAEGTTCKSPEAGACVSHLRTSKATSVARAEGVRKGGNGDPTTLDTTGPCKDKDRLFR